MFRSGRGIWKVHLCRRQLTDHLGILKPVKNFRATPSSPNVLRIFPNTPSMGSHARGYDLAPARMYTRTDEIPSGFPLRARTCTTHIMRASHATRLTCALCAGQPSVAHTTHVPDARLTHALCTHEPYTARLALTHTQATTAHALCARGRCGPIARTQRLTHALCTRKSHMA